MASPFSGRAGRLASLAMEKELQAGEAEAYGFLDKAMGTATNLYGNAQGRLAPIAPTGLAGLGMYADSLGINGANGNQRAVNAFQAGPGYQFAQDAAQQAGLRGASASGMLASGNTLAALSDRAQGVANQEYGNWQNRLQGLGNMGVQVANQQAGLDTGLAALGVSAAGQKAGIATSVADALATAAGSGMMAGQQAAANRMNFGMSLLGGLGGLAKGFF